MKFNALAYKTFILCKHIFYISNVLSTSKSDKNG